MFWDYLISVVTLKIIPNCQIILELFQKMFIAPSQLSAYQSKSINSYRVSLDELTRIGTINQEVSPVGDTPEKRSKRSDHKQLALIVFSRS
jgi:hypothetical protein